ncbi:class III lanthionine synthetase LanKC [Sphaerisporangium aureirubrum]|uniref:Class III lanthionine synthetase LanKC n=1 Tax=Sphaerisporangium aureirubrum TaxID=1544736 RepID=A0ABW1NT24_9ACTN
MIGFHGYAQADPEYYAPLSGLTGAGRRFTPGGVPGGWTSTDQDIWTRWTADGVEVPDQGWKVHVSARLERADAVLGIVARACFAERVAFKHIAAETFFLVLHHKHGPRPQSGKFCAIYPPDEATARRLMERLTRDLAGEQGPYILSDRRFPGSGVVHYRYGAFRRRGGTRPDGTLASLVRDGHGRDVPDTRGVSFAPPAGITDPFAPEPPATPPGPVVINGYEILQAVQPSNSGGSYKARDTRTGRVVFIKEARAHNGLYWDRTTAAQRLRREYETLRELHRAVPGVCPEPLDHFTEWEHDFMVTEFVEGDSLHAWMARHAPLVQAGRGAAGHTAYHVECLTIVDRLDVLLGRIHRAGYRYGDLNPRNVMVTPEGARLVDFESCAPVAGPLVRMGAQGYAPPDSVPLTGPFTWDDYGLSAIALALVMPMHDVVSRSPGNLRWVRREAGRHAPVPGRLWRRATRFHDEHDPAPDKVLPSPDDLDERPRESLTRFAGHVRDGLLGMLSPDRPLPTVPHGFETNTLCVTYGLAGVLHALLVTGSHVPPELTGRFLARATAERDALPPGLHIGAAGVSWVLADLGLLGEAEDLLATAARHPALGDRAGTGTATLGEGWAGVGMAALRLHRGTGDQRHLDLAVRAADGIASLGDPRAALGAGNARGLLHGRSGIALFLHRLAARTGEERHLAHGLRLLHAELDLALELKDGALSFADDDTARRALPYLGTGSAGVALALTRYQAAVPGERIAAALPRVLADTAKTYCGVPGLYPGLAGLAFALADHAEITGDAACAHAALDAARGLVKYAVPDGHGVRFLGDGSLRFSAELWSGGAGVLLALHRVLHGASGHFLLDA